MKRYNNSTKNFTCLLLICATIIFTNIHVFASSTSNPVDEFLLSTGMPEEILSSISEQQKNIIFSTLHEGAVYKSFETLTFPSDNTENNNGIMPIDGTLDTELTLSVMAFEDSNNLYAIYPSFIWNESVKVKNDVFGMCLYPGWEVVPQENNLKIWNRNTSGDLVNSADIIASDSCSSGYAYIVPYDVGVNTLYYEGYAYLYARKTRSSATHAISLKYADDMSSDGSVSFSINLGVASVGISSNSNNVRYKSGNFYF